MYSFDSIVHNLCCDVHAIYTRYSDDITISTNKKNVLSDLYEKIKNVCDEMKSPNVDLNFEKTVFASKKSSRTVTGIVISNNNKISLGRERKRKIRAMIHRIIMNDESNKEMVNKINGYLAFANDIEPDFVQRLFQSYRSDQEDLADKGVVVFKHLRIEKSQSLNI